MFDLLLRNALVVLPDRVHKLDVGVTGGRIAALLQPGNNCDASVVHNLDGCILMPGAIDSHAHVTYCGTVQEGSWAAASGGVTTLIEMPQSGWLPDVKSPEIMNARIKMVHDSSIVDFALWGGVSSDDIGRVEELNALGAVAFKVFTCDAGDYGSFDDAALLELMIKLQSIDGLVGVHAEVESICNAATARVKKEGGGPERHSESRPVIAEAAAGVRAAMLAQSARVRLHVCHVSSPEVISALIPFRQADLQLTLETCPHYLLLTDRDVVRCGAYAKCSPPIRDAAQQEGLWKALICGDLDIIGSDHANYSDDQKGRGFWNSPGGFPGLSVMLAALYSEGVVERGMSLVRLAQVTASNAAKTFGINHRKGAIRIGLDADFAVIDPSVDWVYHASDFAFANESSRYPYEGRCIHGKVIQTFLRGNEIYANGALNKKPIGQVIARGLSENLRHTGSDPK